MIWQAYNSVSQTRKMVLFNGMIFIQRPYADWSFIAQLQNGFGDVERYMNNDNLYTPYTRIERNLLKIAAPALPYMEQQDSLKILVENLSEPQYAAVIDFLLSTKGDRFTGCDIHEVLLSWGII